jgi:UDP-N-acetylglucosamine--N-acetylmuramyl-(pentapeptide) pyrophosphoryl-undecaprenol N-acetylglucosamine transferase
VGKPTLLVPSPNVSEDHQTKNAMALVNKQAAVLVKDAEAKEKVMLEAFAVIGDVERGNALAANIRSLAKPDATAHIVDIITKVAIHRDQTKLH